MADAEIASYSLLSTTRYDEELINISWNTRVNGGVPSRFLLLPYHFDRLAAAAEQHGWTVPQRSMTRDHLAQACDDAVRGVGKEHGRGPFKVRVTIACIARLALKTVRRFAYCLLLMAHLQQARCLSVALAGAIYRRCSPWARRRELYTSTPSQHLRRYSHPQKPLTGLPITLRVLESGYRPCRHLPMRR